ncbi:unnamed protein product [Nezara viridula]|uniref:Uncharacterized protein n=1 Tax=Nezara viridula TaxID=85310 RepID=A0A9P0MRS8_NEZVI|nr:unnamed protein product [Nezara viridula]
MSAASLMPHSLQLFSYDLRESSRVPVYEVAYILDVVLANPLGNGIFSAMVSKKTENTPGYYCWTALCIAENVDIIAGEERRRKNLSGDYQGTAISAINSQKTWERTGSSRNYTTGKHLTRSCHSSYIDIMASIGKEGEGRTIVKAVVHHMLSLQLPGALIVESVSHIVIRYRHRIQDVSSNRAWSLNESVARHPSAVTQPRPAALIPRHSDPQLC